MCESQRVCVWAPTTCFHDGGITFGHSDARPWTHTYTHASTRTYTHTHTYIHSRIVDIAALIDVADYCWRQEQRRCMTHSHSEELPMAFQSIWVNGVTDCFSLSSHPRLLFHSLYLSGTHARTHTLQICSSTCQSKLTNPAVVLPSFNDLLCLL